MFLDPPSASLDLSTFSKISLNTSKPSKGKIVQNVKAHNFAVDWHLKFEEILGEKCFSMCPAPVHRRRVFGQLGIPFLLDPLDKTPISLCKCCRG
jgi:hypothetical protein